MKTLDSEFFYWRFRFQTSSGIFENDHGALDSSSVYANFDICRMLNTEHSLESDI